MLMYAISYLRFENVHASSTKESDVKIQSEIATDLNPILQKLRLLYSSNIGTILMKIMFTGEGIVNVVLIATITDCVLTTQKIVSPNLWISCKFIIILFYGIMLPFLWVTYIIYFAEKLGKSCQKFR